MSLYQHLQLSDILFRECWQGQPVSVAMQMVPEEKVSITTQHQCPQHPHHAQPQYRSAEATLSHYFMEATEFQPLGQPGFIKTK